MNAVPNAVTLAQPQPGGTLALSEDEAIRVLGNSLYPGARPDSIRLVLAWCRATGRDPMKKPIHVVPMYVKDATTGKGEMRDVLMPGIGTYRSDAASTGQYAGKSEPEFGPEVVGKVGDTPMRYPAWCRVTVQRIVGGQVRNFTAKEYWLENYATASRDTASPNAMWRRRPYGQLAKCFDPETEVLTDQGFQRFAKVTGRILQAGQDGLEPTDARPFCQDYGGEMIVADGTRLNFSVTPNHDMVTTAGKIEAGMLYDQATTDASKWFLPRAPINQRPDAPVSDSTLRLAGYFLADGSHSGYRQFRIGVSRDYKIEALREVGLFTMETIKKAAGNSATLDGRQIRTTVDQANFVYPFALIADLVTPEKQIRPDSVLALSQRQARIMVDALLEFDGSDNGVGVRRLSQQHPHVRIAFEVLAVHAGLSVSAWTKTSATVSESAHFPVVRGIAKNGASLVKRKNVVGKVWCVTVPSGVIVVRRRGFSMLCGNCAESQALRMAFPDETGNTNTSEEMEGKSYDGPTIDAIPTPQGHVQPAEPPHPKAAVFDHRDAINNEIPLSPQAPPKRTARQWLDDLRLRVAQCQTTAELDHVATGEDVRKASQHFKNGALTELNEILTDAMARFAEHADAAGTEPTEAELVDAFPGDEP